MKPAPPARVGSWDICAQPPDRLGLLPPFRPDRMEPRYICMSNFRVEYIDSYIYNRPLSVSYTTAASKSGRDGPEFTPAKTAARRASSRNKSHLCQCSSRAQRLLPEWMSATGWRRKNHPPTIP